LSEINQDKKAALSCPKCKSHNLEFVSTPRKPGNWISVLFGLLSFSYAPPVEQVYHCFDCGAEFEKPSENTPD
jgi:DNA-directed RNA polymerase subunit RPC12/RpoP